MQTSIGLLLCAALAVVVDPAQDDVQSDNDKLKGVWKLEAVRIGETELRGEAWKDWKDLRLIFEEDRVVMRPGTATETKAETYKLDPTSSPKQLNIGKDANLKEYIYKFDGDCLIVAYCRGELAAGGTFAQRQRYIRRPLDFKETEGNVAPIVWVLKRVMR